MENEIWRKIPDWNYEASNQGRVRSMPKGNRKGKILKQVTIKGDYQQVSLSNGTLHKSMRVHVAVARLFPEICGEWFEGCVVNHKDCNPKNNKAENLSVTTQRENLLWADRLEKVSKALKNTPKMSKAVAAYTLDGKLVATYPSISEAARQTGLKKGFISLACQGICKTAGGYIWKYI